MMFKVKLFKYDSIARDSKEKAEKEINLFLESLGQAEPKIIMESNQCGDITIIVQYQE